MKSLSKWVDRRSQGTRSTARALALFRAATPGRSTNGWTQVPFAFGGRAWVDLFDHAALNAAIDAAPVQDVALTSFRAIQHTVDVPRVEQYILNPKLQRRGATSKSHGGEVDLPIVVRFRGVNYLYDGHHRATAQLYLGASKLEARFVDLDAMLKAGTIALKGAQAPQGPFKLSAWTSKTRTKTG